MDQYGDAFEKNHPDYKITVVRRPPLDLNNNMDIEQEKLIEEQSIDVLYSGIGEFDTWVKDGVLTSLDPYMKSDDFDKDLFDKFKVEYPKDKTDICFEESKKILDGTEILNDGISHMKQKGKNKLDSYVN